MTQFVGKPFHGMLKQLNTLPLLQDTRINKKLVTIWIYALLPVCGYGLPVADLYVAEVQVAEQNLKQLPSSAQVGLRQILTRISGKQEVMQHAQIRAAMRRPEDYYYQYSYQAIDREIAINHDGETVPGKILRLHFEPNRIANLLREAGFAVWGSNRPSILLWLAMGNPKGRQLLSETNDSSLSRIIMSMAKIRGLPVLFPLLDLEDTEQLSSAEVWGVFLDRIEKASSRYNPDSILTGRIQQLANDQLTATWSYRIEDEWFNFRNVAFTETNLITSILDQLAEDLANRYAIDSSQGVVALNISGIDSLQDYASLLSYLKSLTPVLDTYVAEINGTNILLHLHTEGQIAQLIGIIELDRKMLLLKRADPEAKLAYQWLH